MFGKKNENKLGELDALAFFTATLLEITLANYKKGKDRENIMEYVEKELNGIVIWRIQ